MNQSLRRIILVLLFSGQIILLKFMLNIYIQNIKVFLLLLSYTNMLQKGVKKRKQFVWKTQKYAPNFSNMWYK